MGSAVSSTHDIDERSPQWQQAYYNYCMQMHIHYKMLGEARTKKLLQKNQNRFLTPEQAEDGYFMFWLQFPRMHAPQGAPNLRALMTMRANWQHVGGELNEYSIPTMRTQKSHFLNLASNFFLPTLEFAERTKIEFIRDRNWWTDPDFQTNMQENKKIVYVSGIEIPLHLCVQCGLWCFPIHKKTKKRVVVVGEEVEEGEGGVSAPFEKFFGHESSIEYHYLSLQHILFFDREREIDKDLKPVGRKRNKIWTADIYALYRCTFGMSQSQKPVVSCVLSNSQHADGVREMALPSLILSMHAFKDMEQYLRMETKIPKPETVKDRLQRQQEQTDTSGRVDPFLEQEYTVHDIATSASLEMLYETQRESGDMYTQERHARQHAEALVRQHILRIQNPTCAKHRHAIVPQLLRDISVPNSDITTRFLHQHFNIPPELGVFWKPLDHITNLNAFLPPLPPPPSPMSSTAASSSTSSSSSSSSSQLWWLQDVHHDRYGHLRFHGYMVLLHFVGHMHKMWHNMISYILPESAQFEKRAQRIMYDTSDGNMQQVQSWRTWRAEQDAVVEIAMRGESVRTRRDAWIQRTSNGMRNFIHRVCDIAESTQSERGNSGSGGGGGGGNSSGGMSQHTTIRVRPIVSPTTMCILARVELMAGMADAVAPHLPRLRKAYRVLSEKDHLSDNTTSEEQELEDTFADLADSMLRHTHRTRNGVLAARWIVGAPLDVAFMGAVRHNHSDQFADAFGDDY